MHTTAGKLSCCNNAHPFVHIFACAALFLAVFSDVLLGKFFLIVEQQAQIGGSAIGSTIALGSMSPVHNDRLALLGNNNV